MDLPVGYTAVRWTGPSTMIVDMPNLSSIARIYAHNRVTGSGYIGYQNGRKYPTLTTLITGEDYLIDALVPFSLDSAVASPDGAFSAFTGYTPIVTVTPTVPNTGPGFIATATAAVNIIGGTLVARNADGLIPYSAMTLDLIHLLFGVALNSALPGGMVSVQRGGYVPYPGLGLTTGSTLFVGDNGRFTTSNAGMAFSQIVGRAISPDEFIYQPEAITVLYPFSLQVL